jgi:hypothetical protein
MSDDKEILSKLDEVIELIENLIILEALRVNVAGGDVRGLLGVDMNRVTKISKMLKASKKLLGKRKKARSGSKR